MDYKQSRKNARCLRAALALILFVCMTLPSAFCAGAAQEGLTNGQAAERIAASCDDYAAPTPTAADILGDFAPDGAASHASCAVMLYRGFGALPEATGFRAITGYRETAFTDVPEELAVYVRNLTDAMIYIPENNELFEPDAPMEEEALALLINRIYAYLGTNLKDDYFSAVNHDLLTTPLGENFDPRGLWFTEYDGQDDAFMRWVLQLLEQSADSDAPYMQNIAAYYSTYTSREAREKGALRLKEYLDALLAADDAKALLSVIEKISGETGIPLLLLHSSLENADVAENETYIFSIRRPDFPSFGAEDYLPGGIAYDDAGRFCMTQALMLTGFSEEESAAIVQGYLRNYGAMAALLAREDALEDLTDAFDLTAYLNLCGYPLHESDYRVDRAYLNACLHLFSSPDTFQSFRQSCALNLLDAVFPSVSPRIMDWMAGFWIPYFDSDLQILLEPGNLNAFLFPALSHDIGEAFVSAFDIEPEAAKLRALFEQFKASFAQMIPNEPWLSEETQAEALKKLAAMTIHIGLGEDALTQERARYISAEQGGTQFDNDCLSRKAANANACRYLGRDAHDLSVMVNQYTPIFYNCFYATYCNGVYISLPFLYKDFICADSEARYYANTWILGHEMVHGFDINGSQFNWRGDKENWWQPEDRQHFEALCADVAAYYDQTEYAPGLTCDGTRNIGEDVADIGGIQLALAAAAELEDFDYDQFFRCLAQKYVHLSSRTGFSELLYFDEHAVNRVRVNPMLSLLDQFYQTYGVTETDGMYVPPEKRIRVW